MTNTYQWIDENGNDVEGETGATVDWIASSTQDPYRVRVTNPENGESRIFSVDSAITVGVPPTITAQPQSITVAHNYTATFSVTATGATSYQWQRYISSVWTNIGGATSSSYTTAALKNSTDNGAQFRCIVTGPEASRTSSVATATVAAFGANPAESMTFKAGPETLVSGSAVAIGYTWFHNQSLPVASVLKKVSVYAGGNGTIKLKLATPRSEGGWTITDLQTLTVVSGSNTFQVSNSTLTQQNIPAESMLGIQSDTVGMVRYVADDFLVGYTYFNGDAVDTSEAVAQSYGAEIQLSWEADCTRGAGPYIFQETFNGTTLPARHYTPTGGWSFSGGNAVPTAANKFLIHNYTSNGDRQKIEIDFRITDMNSKLQIVTAPVIGGASSDEGACIGLDFSRNSISHHGNTTTHAVPVMTTEDSIAGFTLGLGVNYRFSLEKVAKTITARITNRDTTATFAVSKDNVAGPVSGLGYGSAGICCYTGSQAPLASGSGIEVTAWREYATEDNPIINMFGDSIMEGAGADNTNNFGQLLLDEINGQGWYDGDGGTTSYAICRRWMFSTMFAMPKYVLILAGANNANSDLETTNFQLHMPETIDRIIRAGSIPVVCYVTPNSSATIQGRINTMNAFLTSMLASRPTAIAVRTDRALSVGRDGVTWDATKMADAVHFDVSGHAAAAEEIIATLLQLFVE
jgi:lysophospholipase L1-like esterase